MPTGVLRLMVADPLGGPPVTVDGLYHGLRLTALNGAVQLQLAALPAHQDDWPELAWDGGRCQIWLPSQHPLEDERAHQCAAYLKVRSPMAAPAIQVLRINGVRVQEAHTAEVLRAALESPDAVAPIAVTAYAFPLAAPTGLAGLAFQVNSLGTVHGWSGTFTPPILPPARGRPRISGYAAVHLDMDGCTPWQAESANGSAAAAATAARPLAHRILVVRRGGCMFVDKVALAQAAGAAAVVIVNTEDAAMLMGAVAAPPVVVVPEDAADVGGEDGEFVAGDASGMCPPPEPADDAAAAAVVDALEIPAVMVPASAGRWLHRQDAHQRAIGRALFVHLAPAGRAMQPYY